MNQRLGRHKNPQGGAEENLDFQTAAEPVSVSQHPGYRMNLPDRVCHDSPEPAAANANVSRSLGKASAGGDIPSSVFTHRLLVTSRWHPSLPFPCFTSSSSQPVCAWAAVPCSRLCACHYPSSKPSWRNPLCAKSFCLCLNEATSGQRGPRI